MTLNKIQTEDFTRAIEILTDPIRIIDEQLAQARSVVETFIREQYNTHIVSTQIVVSDESKPRDESLEYLIQRYFDALEESRNARIENVEGFEPSWSGLVHDIASMHQGLRGERTVSSTEAERFDLFKSIGVPEQTILQGEAAYKTEAGILEVNEIDLL